MSAFLKTLVLILAIFMLSLAPTANGQKTKLSEIKTTDLQQISPLTDSDIRRIFLIQRSALQGKTTSQISNVTPNDIAKLWIIKNMPKADFARLHTNANARNKARLQQIRRLSQSKIKRVSKFYKINQNSQPVTIAKNTTNSKLSNIPKINANFGGNPFTAGYVLTHEHPMVAMAFGGNYAFTGAPNNFANGIMTNGYTASCGGCSAGEICDHGEVKGSFMAAIGALGGDMGNHSSYIGPVEDSFSHLRYSTEWIREAYAPPQSRFSDTRMRIMVAFAVDNEAMCEMLYYENRNGGGPGGNGFECTPGDSIASLERQIQAMKNWAAANSSWVEIAYSASDARRIVSSNRLAIILGVESDYTFGAESKKFDPVKRLNRLYNKGVRTFYLAHKVNNRLTGADVYAPQSTSAGKVIRANQAIAGCLYYDDNVGVFPLNRKLSSVERIGTSAYRHYYCDNDERCGENNIRGFGITNQCNAKMSEISEINMMSYVVDKGNAEFNGFEIYPSPPGFSDPGGTSGGSKTDHYNIERNNLGLSIDGERVIRAAMRKGMIINIDHVSSKSRIAMREISAEFNDYPLNALHNRPNTMLVGRSNMLQSAKDTPYPNEYDFDDSELEFIKETGGFFGAILGPMDAQEGKVDSGVLSNCPRTSTENAKMLAYLLEKGLSVGYSLDFATITKGFNSRSFEGCGLSEGTDVMDKYGPHETNGLAHIGMIKKFHKELEIVGLKPKYLNKLKRKGAEQFLVMWENSEIKANTMQSVTIIPN